MEHWKKSALWSLGAQVHVLTEKEGHITGGGEKK